MKSYAIIVDPYSTGRELAPAFRGRGVEPVAALSTAEPPKVMQQSWLPENFNHVHVWSGEPSELDELATTLEAYQPRCIVTGAESGVEFADLLVERLLPGAGNRPELSAARRDKWQMALALQRAGVPHLRQIASDDATAVEEWIENNGLTGRRLVLKPPKSLGTDEVHIVMPDADWKPTFHRVLGGINLLGIRNDVVLVQEFAEGTEYIVDTYSVDGQHGLVDVCAYTKASRGDRIGIYDRVDFLPEGSSEVDDLYAYTKRVLDAVGIRNGPGHSEVVNTADGPRLLEVAARPAGGGHQLVSRLATGDCHIDRCVRHHVDGDFRENYRLLQHVRAAFISSPCGGVWRNAEVFDAADHLPTFHSKNIMYRTGDTVPSTLDIFTPLGWVILASTEEEKLHADYLRLKELEQQVQVD